ncbi:hypothetical protein LINGRAHAP2_LOCUS6302 [Linum grandiflorum]
MATKIKSPVFPLPDEHHHFTDYGFDPQIHFFQFLEEARKHKPPQDTTTNLQFKLQKPIEQAPKTKIRKQRWWKNALLFFNLKRTHRHHHHNRSGEEKLQVRKKSREVRSGSSSSSSMSGPVYITESRSGSSTPYRRTYSGPIAGTLTLPYVSLKELELEEQSQRVSISSLPIYLVT